MRVKQLKKERISHDTEDRLTQVSGTATASFGYDGDGKRVVGVENGTTTVYIGNYYEWHGMITDSVKYYYSGATRVAMRVGVSEPVYLMGDHLGSTSVAVDENGVLQPGSPQLYKAWGETRAGGVETKYQYTGQYNQVELGIYYYNARWYDPSIMRFAQADSIIPLAGQGIQAFDRYAYGFNNPIKYRDPNGHWIESAIDILSLAYDIYDISQNGLSWENGLALAADVGCLALPIVAGGGAVVRVATHTDDVADAVRAVDRIVPFSDEAIKFGKSLIDDLGEQIHHIASNCNKTWTSQFEAISQKYGGLKSLWNKLNIAQNSKHSNEYHKWVLDAMRRIDAIAQGDLSKFTSLWEKYVSDVVGESPWLLKPAWWEKYGDEFWDWWDEIKEGIN